MLSNINLNNSSLSSSCALPNLVIIKCQSGEGPLWPFSKVRAWFTLAPLSHKSFATAQRCLRKATLKGERPPSMVTEFTVCGVADDVSPFVILPSESKHLLICAAKFSESLFMVMVFDSRPKSADDVLWIGQCQFVRQCVRQCVRQLVRQLGNLTLQRMQSKHLVGTSSSTLQMCCTPK